jgi:hypothetical protein
MCLATSLAGYLLGGNRLPWISLSNFKNLETPFFGDFRNVFIQNASTDPADSLVRPEVREMTPGKSKAEITWRCREIYAPGDALMECTNCWSTRLFGVPRKGPCQIYYIIRDRNLMEFIYIYMCDETLNVQRPSKRGHFTLWEVLSCPFTQIHAQIRSSKTLAIRDQGERTIPFVN